MGRRFSAALACLLVFAVAAPAAATAKKKRPNPVYATLDRLEAHGGTDAEHAQAWRALYQEARRGARDLDGADRDNLEGVLHDLASLARRNLLAGRGVPAFLILQRNVEWFLHDGSHSVAYGTRTTFDDSEVIFEFYPGHGWQVQPLANFGRLNGLLTRRRISTARLERFGDDLLALGVTRRGFLAFEYYFPFSGGPPGWVSGMATATGMQALANLGKRVGDQRFVDAAAQMLPVFQAGPPWGVTVQGDDGPVFLLYSQSPSELVGNGYAQAIIALDKYREATGDPRAAALVDGALAEARGLLPSYDTGAWSLYSRSFEHPGTESTLSYHQLFTGFLDTMCERFADPFCAIAANFHRYETEPIALDRLRGRVQRKRKRLVVRFDMSKRGSATVTLTRDGDTVRSYSGSLLRGRHTITWPLPRHGAYDLNVHATSLNGIASETTAPVAVPRRR